MIKKVGVFANRFLEGVLYSIAVAMTISAAISIDVEIMVYAGLLFAAGQTVRHGHQKAQYQIDFQEAQKKAEEQRAANHNGG